SESCVDDLYILTRHRNHALGNVQDADWLPHLQNEDFTNAPDTACLQYQLAGLRNGHEVTSSIWVSHCQGLVFVNKTNKGGEHRATAADDVAKADCKVLLSILLPKPTC